ncbi:hypothetical protein Dvina_27925 [Dactylosporangium vinaceum]|uniref:Clp R domain-containing protein n=1 Tax=Dactylosporangium vinaceum TaxID=53362 RepID=A0ABV5MCL6_9ACTN|nr:hypothetical protein [Dactylosporangium vinaceum]UAB92209.1 hypothetical protein Dvina_27925 [Dactylosporangium vinaceum]
MSLAEKAPHIGTEHLLAALVRRGPKDVVTDLSTWGATPEAVNVLLARLAGGRGVEMPPEGGPAAVNLARRSRLRSARGRALVVLAVILLPLLLVVGVCVLGPIFGP